MRISTFSFILIISFLINSGTGMISPIITGLLRDYGYDYTYASVPFLFLIVGRIISKFFSGFIVNRIGAKETIQFFSLLYFIAFILYTFSTNYLFISCIRFIEGLVEGIIIVILMDYSIEHSGDQKGKRMGMFSASIGLGFIVGPFLSGIIVKYINNINMVFYIASFMGFLGFLISRLHLNNVLPKMNNYSIKLNAETLSLIRTYSGIYSPTYLRRILFVILMIILPFYLVDHFGIKYSYATTFFTVSALIISLGVVFTGKIADRFNSLYISFSSILVVAFSIFLFPFANDLTTFWVLYIMVSIAFAFMYPSSMKIFSEKIENSPLRTKILGVLGTITEFATLILSFIIPIVYKYNIYYSWYVISFVAICISIWFLISIKLFTTNLDKVYQ